MSSVHIKHEPFEGKPQTVGDERQAKAPYRIHYKHHGTQLPAVLGFSEAEARSLLKEMHGLFPGDAETADSTEATKAQAKAILETALKEASATTAAASETAKSVEDAAWKKAKGVLAEAKDTAAKETKAAKEAADLEATAIKSAAKKGAHSITVLGRDKPQASKGSGSGGESPPTEGEPAEHEMVKLIRAAEHDAKDWAMTGSGVNAEGVFLDFPDGSKMAICITDTEHGLFAMKGVRKTAKGDAPFFEEDLDTQKVLALVNKIAPVMQGEATKK